MMRELLHAHVVVLVTVATAATISALVCPKPKPADTPTFTQKLGDRDYVRFDHSIAVLCCAEGYDDIKWYKQHDDVWVSFPPPPHGDANTPDVQEDGQILRFYTARLSDEANYRCDVIKNSTVMLHHTMDLVIIECDPLARGPIVTAPYPQNKTILEYGGNVTFHCTGYFGCQDRTNDGTRLALWTIHGKEVHTFSPRYSVSHVSGPLVIKEASLSITSVQEVDTTRTFLCTLASPQSIEGQTIIAVRIFKQERTKVPWLLLGLIIGGCVLFIILLICIVTCLHCLYGPQIRLYFNSRMPTLLAPKTIDNEQYVYNLYIHHAVEDEGTAQDIKMNLAEKNYTTYITADIGGDKTMMTTFFQKTSQSALVLFLYSDNLRKDELSNFFLQALITERKGKDIMFLEVTHYKPKEVMNWTLDAKDMTEPQGTDGKGRTVLNTEDIGNSLTENDGPDGVEKTVMDKKAIDEIEDKENKKKEIAADKKHDIVEDLKFWKVLPRVKVPSDRNNVRKMVNFWCSLQNKIPKFDHQKHQQKEISRKRPTRGRNSSSQKPLLGDVHSESPPLSAVLHNNDTAEESSPSTNEVFTFGESGNNEQHVPTVLNPQQNLINFNKNTSETICDNNFMDDSSDDAAAGYACNNTVNGCGDGHGELQTEDYLAQGNHKRVHLVDVDIHHGENSDLPTINDNIRYAGNDRNHLQIRQQNGTTDVLHGADEPGSTEDIFTMSGEEPKICSVGSEYGYSEANSSNKGSTRNYTTSDSGEDSTHGLLSSQSSSGFSDCNSPGSSSLPDSMSSTGRTNLNAAGPSLTVNDNNCIPYNRHSNAENGEINGNGKLKVRINRAAINRNMSSSSPESGYITSTSERSSSTGAFLPKIKEHVERGKEVPVAEPQIYRLN